MSRSNESRPRTAIPRALRFAPTVLVAITALSISACESPFADKEQKPTPTPTFNVFSTPTPRPGDGEIQALLGADFSMPDAGFFVRFPGEWTLDTDDPAGFEVVFRSRKPDRDQTGQAFAAISVATDTYPQATPPFEGGGFSTQRLKKISRSFSRWTIFSWSDPGCSRCPREIRRFSSTRITHPAPEVSTACNTWYRVIPGSF